MFKDYEDIRNWLENFIPLVYGKEELGLLRIKNLLKKLGNPEKKFKSVHVAGTAGKGSTSFYIARLLEFSRNDLSKTQGRTLKIGLHISPHLVDIRERMQIFSSPSVIPAKAGIHKSKKQILDPFEDQGEQVENDKDSSTLMPMKRFIALVNEIKPSVDAIGVSQPELLPSYFEILVALSFLYFEKEKVDIAVVEVGLGGRLDATNVLVPEISVITNIGLDHTELLGDTVEKIAKEKAGIIKSKVSKVSKGSKVSNVSIVGVPVVTAATGKSLKVIEKVAKAKNALLINIYTQGIKNLQNTDALRSIAKPNDIYRYIPNYVNVECALLALTTVLELYGTGCLPESSRGDSLSLDIIKQAFSVGFPGRFEEIDCGVIIDGAHNTDKIKTLIEFLNQRHSRPRTGHSALDSESVRGRPDRESDPRIPARIATQSIAGGRKDDTDGIILVVAFKKGKNWQEMIDLLIKNLPIKKIIATQYFATTDMGKGSAVEAEEIVEYAGDRRSLSVNRFKMIDVRVVKNSQEAVYYALTSNQLTPNELILVTGSLYLIGEVRTLWKIPEF